MEQLVETGHRDVMLDMSDAEFREKYSLIAESEEFVTYVKSKRNFAERTALRRRLEAARVDYNMWWSDAKMDVLVNYIYARLAYATLAH